MKQKVIKSLISLMTLDIYVLYMFYFLDTYVLFSLEVNYEEQVYGTFFH